jgi:hypothetical protein
MRLHRVTMVLFLAAAASSAALAEEPPPPSAPPPQAAPAPAPAAGDDAEARRKLEEQIRKDLGQGGTQGQAPVPPPGAAGQGGQAQGGAGSTGGNPMARLLLLPDISAIGSFAAAFNSYDVGALSPRTGPFAPQTDKLAFLFEELELGLQSVIDPYARADVFISFVPGGVNVEEAYATTLNLPASLQLRAGQFFSPLGRQNQQHPHVWDFIDAPLARTRLVAADVLSGPGVDLAWLTPLPWFAEVHVDTQSTNPFPDQPGAQDRLTGVVRLLQYFSFTEATTLGLGLSAARRDQVTGGGFADLGAVDLYLRWRPPATRSYVALQAELYGRRFVHVDLPTAGSGYAQLFWRQNAYLGYGVRYDQAPSGPDYGAPATAESGIERRTSAVASWFPSEFQRLRLQLTYDQRPGGREGFEALLGLEFGIGAHGAHPF